MIQTTRDFRIRILYVSKEVTWTYHFVFIVYANVHPRYCYFTTKSPYL